MYIFILSLYLHEGIGSDIHCSDWGVPPWKNPIDYCTVALTLDIKCFNIGIFSLVRKDFIFSRACELSEQKCINLHYQKDVE